MFIRAVGGHSKDETIARAPNAEILQPCDSIHFAPLHVLVQSPEHVRPNGDSVLLHFTVDLDQNNIPLHLAKNYYVVTDAVVPPHCCMHAYDARNKQEVNPRVFPISNPEDFDQSDERDTILNVLRFYESYFENRLHLTNVEKRPYGATSTTREALKATEESMHPYDLQRVKEWSMAEIQSNVGLKPFQQFLTTEPGIAFSQKFMKESGRRWPQDPEATGELDLERTKARRQEKKGTTDISALVPDDQEYCEVTDEEDEFLEEQHDDVLEEAVAEEVAKKKRWVRKDRATSPSPVDTDAASQVTFRPRTTSTRQRSRTPEPGQIRSKNKMAREVLEDAHASERRDRRRDFWQRPPDVTRIAKILRHFSVEGAETHGAPNVTSITKMCANAQHR